MTHISIYYVAKEMYYPINLFNETIYDYNIIYILNSVIRKKNNQKNTIEQKYHHHTITNPIEVG